jgi:hypothetical protein
MAIDVDENIVREFISIISAHATELNKGNGHPGVLQLCTLSPVDEKIVPHRFALDDVKGMVKTALTAAAANLNVYLDTRTVRADLQGCERGKLEDTVGVFGLVVDADHDKNKGGQVVARPSLAVETSPGNHHFWYLFDRAVPGSKAKEIGEAMRQITRTDHDTGVVTQCYRVAGTPNYPSKAKRARGRTTVEATRLVEWNGRLWEPDELLAAHLRTMPSHAPNAPRANGPAGSIAADEATLPDDLLESIRVGGVSRGLGAKEDKSRSGLFHHVVSELHKRRWRPEAIAELFAKYANGVAAKYAGRVLEEVERSYCRIESDAAAATQATSAASAGPAAQAGGGSTPPPPGATAGPAPRPAPAQGPQSVLPTIRLRDGHLPEAVAETEKAVIASNANVFARTDNLVYPASELVQAVHGGKTVSVRLREYTVDSFVEPVAAAAIFQRYNERRKGWVDVDPPVQLVRMLLARSRKWAFPRIAGIITTPTLRPDGSLLADAGYDPETELYLWDALPLPAIPEKPTRQEALSALATLKSLFVEFSFRKKTAPTDLVVALAGLLTALLRGSLPTAPIFLVVADTPGTGKSYLVDLIAVIATGQLCPVITTSRSSEETEKRLGAVLLSASSIISLDNVTHDLDSELLCQVTERPIVRIRILGRSEMPICECRTAMFATGNNITYTGDMIRRGLICNLEADSERPEFREFKQNILVLSSAERAKYVAAALTLVRAYLVSGEKVACKPFGSYSDWSRMAREPLIWLGEPDPVDSLEEIRADDPILGDIREFFDLWRNYLAMDVPYTTARIIEIASEQAPTNFNPPWLKLFLLRVGMGKTGELSPERVGRWMRRISGRIIDEHRLLKERSARGSAAFRLVRKT